ncbi:hypothetical protein BU100_07215 [Staphylococcus xylosus]|uniref:phage tail assembly chaperone G n=1 Tax=Staphylococcus xylosus TaxID=1288 RepID=UPI000E683B87|nr:hypothetical protein [Staphylococcus xylosus]RIM94785.1 hypothetical protein BU100_07215 [Staphylococcus xylosus]
MAKRTKRNFVELIQEVNDKGEITKSNTFLTPPFTPGPALLDLQDRVMKVEKNNFKSEKEALYYMIEIIVDFYKKQFTADEFLEGTNAPEVNDKIKEQIQFISDGVVNEENERRLKELLK